MSLLRVYLLGPAEFRQWFVEAGLDPAFLMDDWLETDATFEEAQLRMRTLYEIATHLGRVRYGGEQIRSGQDHGIPRHPY